MPGVGAPVWLPHRRTLPNSKVCPGRGCGAQGCPIGYFGAELRFPETIHGGGILGSIQPRTNRREMPRRNVDFGARVGALPPQSATLSGRSDKANGGGDDRSGSREAKMLLGTAVARPHWRRTTLAPPVAIQNTARRQNIPGFRDRIRPGWTIDRDARL